MSEYQNNSIFWVETTKIEPNPFQPRREFEPRALDDLADSIRQYGILQPLVVTRKEIIRPDHEGMDVIYELIAGERRLRASKIAGLHQVPVIIRKETDNKIKLELAIIENLQREDLNPIDRALAFEQLYKEFNLTHVEIGKRMGKSRVYVSNTLRLLSLPEEIKQGLMARRISEGHTRPLLMLTDRPEEQTTLYKEIMVKKMSVRDAEKVARKIAQDKVRKKEFVVDPKIRAFEKRFAENLGTRVHIEPKEKGGQITIDYFTIKDLEEILSSMQKVEREQSMMESYLSNEQDKAEKEIEKSTSFSFNPVIKKAPMTLVDVPSVKEPETHANIPVVHHKELPEYHKIPDSDIVPFQEGKNEISLSQKNIHVNVPVVHHKELPEYHKAPDSDIIPFKADLAGDTLSGNHLPSVTPVLQEKVSDSLEMVSPITTDTFLVNDSVVEESFVDNVDLADVTQSLQPPQKFTAKEDVLMDIQSSETKEAEAEAAFDFIKPNQERYRDEALVSDTSFGKDIEANVEYQTDYSRVEDSISYETSYSEESPSYQDGFAQGQVAKETPHQHQEPEQVYQQRSDQYQQQSPQVHYQQQPIRKKGFFGRLFG